MNRSRITGKRKAFSQVSNEPLQNNELSLKAKGLYALIESYVNIPDFKLYKNTLLKDCKEGKSAFQSAWKELKDAGYLIQKKHKNKNGKYYYEYELLFETTYRFSTPGFSTPGKQGVFNNTDFNNTNLNNTKPLRNSKEFRADGYIYFKNLDEKDLIKRLNSSIDSKRKKIKEENYFKAGNRIHDFLSECSKQDLAAIAKEYISDKATGRSVENFIEHLNRYGKEL